MTLQGVRSAKQSRRRRKLGEVVAERIIAEIIEQGWREGLVLGTERDFMDHYRVSRATFREAMRQVEWHGIAGMRRGANGGLVVKAPPRDALVLAFKTYLELSKVPRAEQDAARATLRKAERATPDSGENQAIALLLEALDERTLVDLARERRAAGISLKLSEQVAYRILRDIEKANFDRGTNLGSEGDLQARYGVSRAILREALRPLELHEVVRVKTGVQGGVIVHDVDPSYTFELAATYLSYSRIPMRHNWEAHAALELEAIARFAARATDADMLQLDRALARLNTATAPLYLVAAAEFHQVIADHCGNRAIALLVRLFLTYTPKVTPTPDERFLPMLKEAHHSMIEALRGHDVDRVVSLMRDMFDHSRRWLLRLEKCGGIPAA